MAIKRGRLLSCVVTCGITFGLWLVVGELNTRRSVELDWVRSLDDSQLRSAAARIEVYPVSFRQAILGVLPAAARAAVLADLADKYLRANPTLAPSDRELVTRLAELWRFTGESGQTPEAAAAVPELSSKIRLRLGEGVHELLFKGRGSELGDGAWRNLPISVRLASFLRSHFVADAEDECECHINSDCEEGEYCWIPNGCSVVFSACGPDNQFFCENMCKKVALP